MINVIRNAIADMFVFWAMDLYSKDDLKISLAQWILDNFKRTKK